MKEEYREKLAAATEQLDKELGTFYDKWKSRIDGISQQIEENDGKLDEINAKLQEATEAVDTRQMLSLRKEREDYEATAVLLVDTLKNAQDTPIYTDKDLEESYARFCENVGPVFNEAVEAMQKAHTWYQEAYNNLIELTDSIRETKLGTERKSKNREVFYLEALLTKDMPAGEYLNTVGSANSKEQYGRLAGIFMPLMSNARI